MTGTSREDAHRLQRHQLRIAGPDADAVEPAAHGFLHAHCVTGISGRQPEKSPIGSACAAVSRTSSPPCARIRGKQDRLALQRHGMRDEPAAGLQPLASRSSIVCSERPPPMKIASGSGSVGEPLRRARVADVERRARRARRRSAQPSRGARRAARARSPARGRRRASIRCRSSRSRRRCPTAARPDAASASPAPARGTRAW